MAGTPEVAHEKGTGRNVGPHRGPMGRLLKSSSFYPLFLVLLVSLVFTVGSSGHLWGAIIGQVLAAGSLLLAIKASHASRTWTVLGWIALVCGIAGTLFQAWLDFRALRLVVSVVFVALLFASVPLILRRLATHRQVTAETVVGALSAYLLLGMDFAVLNILVSAIEGQSIIVSLVAPEATVTRGDFFYHSFITMTTVGFGDFVAITGSAKTLALLEGVLGQLFLVTVVARLVSVATFGQKGKDSTEELGSEETAAASSPRNQGR